MLFYLTQCKRLIGICKAVFIVYFTTFFINCVHLKLTLEITEIKIINIIHKNHDKYSHKHCDTLKGGLYNWNLSFSKKSEIKLLCFNYCVGFCQTDQNSRALKYEPDSHTITTLLRGLGETAHAIVGIKKTNYNFLLEVTIIFNKES